MSGGVDATKGKRILKNTSGHSHKNGLGLTQAKSAESATDSNPKTMVSKTNLPNHIAFICDGNGRWASKRGLGRLSGHQAGVSTVSMVVEQCIRLGIPYVTLYSFSTENWFRPEAEVKGLLEDIILDQLKKKLESSFFIENGVRIRIIGQRDRLPKDLQEAIAEAECTTRSCTKLNLTLAFSYGGREEILHATRQLALDAKQGLIDPNQITDEAFTSKLWTADLPDPDLLIRTGGEVRLSNFLLWQLCYAEFIFAPEHWPEFTKASLQRCLAEWSARERRYGRSDVGAPEPFSDVVV